MKIGRWWPAFIAVVPLIVLAYVFPLERSAVSYTIGFTVSYLMFGGLVVAARVHPDFGRSGPQRLLAGMGIYSYTIYLAHSVIYELPGMLAVRSMVVSRLGAAGDQLLFLSLSIVLGVIISHLVERPFLRLRAKWFPASPPSVSTSAEQLTPSAVPVPLPLRP